MWSDNETNRDFLNFRIVADTIAELVVQAEGKPLSVGICGGWGVGKSSMVKLVQESLTESSFEKFVFVEFNAWLYQGFDDARAALMEIIAQALVTSAKDNETKLEKTRAFLKRVDWVRATGLVASAAIPMAFGIPPLGLVGQLAHAVHSFTDGTVTSEDLEGVKKAGTAVVNSGKTLLRPKEVATPPQQIQDLRDHFKDALKELGVTIVVFVDDLDRCSPQTAISTLEAIRLFLFIENTAFVIAADDQMIRRAVRAHFSGMELTDDLVTNYFDKLIQVPVRVPPLGTQEVRAYLFLLFIENSSLSQQERDNLRGKICGQLSRTWQGHRVDRAFAASILPQEAGDLATKLDIADQIAPLMTSATAIGGNPRLIKRFLNTLAIRSRLAKTQGVSVDEAVLTKLLLFERCGPPALVSQLVKAISESDDGCADFLAKLEKAAADQNYGEFPPEWNDEFAKEWLVLSPTFSGVDLRAALHVSKDQHPIISRAQRLSPAALEMLEALQVFRGRTDKTFQGKIDALTLAERGIVLDQLIAKAKGANSWASDSPIHGICAAAGTTPEYCSKVIRFLKTIPSQQLKPGIVQSLKDKAWTHEVLRHWVLLPELPQPTKIAIEQVISN